MSSPVSSDGTDRATTKRQRLENPSGFLHLARHESVPLVIDALLDLPPGREVNKTELADHAGVTRQTVGEHVDLLVETEVLEPVSGTRPTRYRLAESAVVRELLELNSALGAATE